MPSAIRGHISRAANAKLAVLIVTNFVDMVGLLMIIPLLPFYAREMGGGALIVAMLMGSFMVSHLLSAPCWSRANNTYGSDHNALTVCASVQGRLAFSTISVSP